MIGRIRNFTNCSPRNSPVTAIHPGNHKVAKLLAAKGSGKYTEQEILDALRFSGLKDSNGAIIVAEGTQEILIPSGATLANVITGTTIQETYKVDGAIALRPDASYPGTLVENKGCVAIVR